MAENRPPTFDHLRKKPLEQRVTIVLDDDVIEALNDARADLADAEQAADATYERKLTLARSANPPASELLTIEGRLDADREKALVEPRAAVDAAEAAVREASQEFVFRSPGRKAFEDLIAEHAPTDEDHDDMRRMTGRPEALARWHSDTFMPALVAACAVDPKISPEQAEAMYADWTDAEIGELFGAAIAVCQGARQVDLGKASRAARKRG
jgi:hypothetical protein